MGQYARRCLEVTRSGSAPGAVKKKTRNRVALIFYPGSAGGNSLGGAAGFFSRQRRVVAGHRRPALLGASLFVKSVLVAVGAPLWRPAHVGADVHAGNRR